MSDQRDIECPRDDDGSCALCGDVAIPMRVLAVNSDNMAVVRTADRESSVAIDLLDAVTPGDLLLVQQGFAIARLEQS